MDSPTAPFNTTSFDGTPTVASSQVSHLSDLVEGLEESNSNSNPLPDTSVEPATESETYSAAKRQAIAANLFRGLKAKHDPTAAHGLRVAFGCSVWVESLDESDEFCRVLETAALLHDIGKIGVPDEILAKPSKLTDEELETMASHRVNGIEILTSCGCSPAVIEAIAYSSAWFDGSVGDFSLKRSEIPVAARMLAIVDAFDSMTTDQVYRRAMSVERAIAELFQHATRQFDPELVASFCGTVAGNWSSVRQSASKRWISKMESGEEKKFWNAPPVAPPTVAKKVENTPPSEDQSELFHKALVDNMSSGVIYIGQRQRIIVWNRSMERLTGISASCVTDKQFLPSLFDMRHENGGDQLLDQNCPIVQVFETGLQMAKRVCIMGRGGKPFTADLLIIPVITRLNEVIGATVTVSDVSSKLSLEQRVESLYTRVTQDPLTGVANRAEFDRVQADFVEKHLRDNIPCSLIMCDLDYFKKINDDYGHQAGDQALIQFAAILKRYQHIGDLVARYGGEEFVLVCADCDNATATARANEIRQVLQSTPQPALDNKCLTCSFGVTEIQSGDTPETMLRRADRALLLAKERGRNQVVQLGAGTVEQQPSETFKLSEKKTLFGWVKGNKIFSERTLVTYVPVQMAIEKLRGFVSDQFAQIVSIDDEVIKMRADGHVSSLSRRKADRPVPFTITLKFSKMTDAESNGQSSTSKTKVDVMIEPIRSRDRRRSDLMERANQVICSLKAYLMATDHTNGERPMLTPAATESGRD